MTAPRLRGGAPIGSRLHPGARRQRLSRTESIMSRQTVAAVVACLYVAVLAWLVKSEGQAHRTALRRDREVRNGPAEGGPSNVLVKSEDQGPPERTTAPSPPAPAVAVVPAPGEPATPSIPAPAPVPAPVPASPPAQPPPRDPAFVWADSLDLASLKPADERRLGRELNRLIMTANRRMEAGPYEQKIEEVARPLLEHRVRKDFEYTFIVLDSDTVGAFSTPGGYVYVCRGLFDMFGEDEGYVLEFVVGHEIAHVELNHAVSFLAGGNLEEKKRGVGTLLQFYFLIAFGYPEAQEFEADAWVFRHMKHAGRSRRELLAFLRKFKKYSENHGFGNGGKPPEFEHTDASVVENHFRAHPAAWKRLSRLEALAGPLTPAASGPTR
jgi:Zn-dependent protease with chaperone function